METEWQEKSNRRMPEIFFGMKMEEMRVER